MLLIVDMIIRYGLVGLGTNISITMGTMVWDTRRVGMGLTLLVDEFGKSEVNGIGIDIGEI
jgi:hypothetical protein